MKVIGGVRRLDKLLRQKEVTEITTLSRSKIYEMMDAEKFPRPLKIGAQAVAWKSSEIQAWIDALERSTGWNE